MRLIILFIILNILLSACQEVVTPVDQADSPNIFFDLKDFFEKEKKRLAAIKSFKKTVSINDITEEKNLDQLNLDNELSIFIASDINRPAWSEKYKVDSIFTSQNELTQINYTNLDESLKTKKITIDFKDNEVIAIIIKKGLDNPVAQSKQTLIYQVGKGYSIQSEQALSLSETKKIIVKVDLMP